uniref:Uncharacterized protein n=1 Tax=Leersia perrieri TaxID=77586 RepID=A0A0D9W254_9ORYZ
MPNITAEVWSELRAKKTLLSSSQAARSINYSRQGMSTHTGSELGKRMMPVRNLEHLSYFLTSTTPALETGAKARGTQNRDDSVTFPNKADAELVLTVEKSSQSAVESVRYEDDILTRAPGNPKHEGQTQRDWLYSGSLLKYSVQYKKRKLSKAAKEANLKFDEWLAREVDMIWLEFHKANAPWPQPQVSNVQLEVSRTDYRSSVC